MENDRRESQRMAYNAMAATFAGLFAGGANAAVGTPQGALCVVPGCSIGSGGLDTTASLSITIPVPDDNDDSGQGQGQGNGQGVSGNPDGNQGCCGG